MSFLCILLVSFLGLSSAHAEGLDDLDPRSPDIEKTLQQMDDAYEAATGQSSHLPPETAVAVSCRRETCSTWARINLKEQLFYLYVNGTLTYTWATSTGKTGFETPLMERHPTSRVYDSYTSEQYPGGDYQGMGNMPHAVFVFNGYAIHGTTEANWPLLGTPVSAGCIRLLPDQGKIFNRLVRSSGRLGTWVTVESGE